MLEEYQKEVLETYHRRKGKNDLTNHLLYPTAANLRKECAIVFHQRPDVQVQSIFQSFARIGLNIVSAADIESIDPDKFRPLLNYINVVTKRPEAKVVELLAWLIDFSPRPYQSWLIVGHGKETILEQNKFQTSFGERKLNSSTKIIFAMIFMICIVSFLFWKNKMDRIIITKDEKCMYWNGDSYEAVACNLETNGVKIPLDITVLKRLKRITQPDTLTKLSIGKVWYGKVNGKPDFYTASGTHPLNVNKRLMPLTDYMLKKYVSYHRYQLQLLIWSIGGFFLTCILSVVAFKFFRKGSSFKKV